MLIQEEVLNAFPTSKHVLLAPSLRDCAALVGPRQPSVLSVKVPWSLTVGGDLGFWLLTHVHILPCLVSWFHVTWRQRRKAPLGLLFRWSDDLVEL